MDHSAMGHNMSAMDHAAMGHDMSAMDHAVMGHDMSAMDHSGHDMGNLHMGMVMTFHGGYEETILFDFWQTKTLFAFLVSCFILFVFAALYEGLKLAREKLIAYELKKTNNVNGAAVSITRNCHCNSRPNLVSCEEAEALNNNSECCANKTKSNNETHNRLIQNTSPEVVVKSYSSRLFSQGHLIQTFLHMFQITVSYLLMLVFMTYNTWLCVAVVLGAGAGYFFFGVHRLTAIDVNEHCH